MARIFYVGSDRPRLTSIYMKVEIKMQINEFDIVLLKDGREGTVIDMLKDGAMMLDISDSKGQVIDMPIITADDVQEVTYRHHGTGNN